MSKQTIPDSSVVKESISILKSMKCTVHELEVMGLIKIFGLRVHRVELRVRSSSVQVLLEQNIKMFIHYVKVDTLLQPEARLFVNVILLVLSIATSVICWHSTACCKKNTGVCVQLLTTRSCCNHMAET